MIDRDFITGAQADKTKQKNKVREKKPVGWKERTDKDLRFALQEQEFG
jgi:hypothetical protein